LLINFLPLTNLYTIFPSKGWLEHRLQRSHGARSHALGLQERSHSNQGSDGPHGYERPQGSNDDSPRCVLSLSLSLSLSIILAHSLLALLPAISFSSLPSLPPS
jgi:hypothetical protein